MMLLVHLIQAVQRQVRVHLRRRNVGMTKNGLHRTQIGAILHHVRRATVPQHMGTGVTSRFHRRGIYDLPHSLASDSLCSPCDE